MENKIKINCVIGIDPGANGGIAIFIPGMKTKAIKMPKDNSDLWQYLNITPKIINRLYFWKN